jgi:hypothetical protein
MATPRDKATMVTGMAVDRRGLPHARLSDRDQNLTLIPICRFRWMQYPSSDRMNT